MENQTPPPVGGLTIPQAAPTVVPVTTSMPESQPVQNVPPLTPPSSGGSRRPWIIVAIVVILLLVAGGYYYFVVSQQNSNLPTYPSPTVMPQTTTAPVPTATSIQSSADLDSVLNQIDSMTISATTELDANTADSTTFSQ